VHHAANSAFPCSNDSLGAVSPTVPSVLLQIECRPLGWPVQQLEAW
jgi:hypothetical protein